MTVRPVEFENSRFWVTSATQADVLHLVDLDYDGAPACSCEDFMCRNRECKHIRAVKDFVTASVTVS